MGIRVHHINPQAIRLSDSSGVSESKNLNYDGSNVAGVLQHVGDNFFSGPNAWLREIVPGMQVQLDKTHNGSFRLSFEQLGKQWYTLNVSHGTLDALGVIVALHQDPAPSLVVIEEPEANLHPGALAVIADLIQEASERMQVVITTHSPELLDQKWIGPENLRVVTWEDGATRVSPVSPLAQAALTDHLKRRYAGQLLRTNLLQPAPHKTDVAA
jgi:predicted ATPase